MGKLKQRKQQSQSKKIYAASIPLSVVVNISLLAASLNVLIQLATGESELYPIILRSMLVFIGFAIASSIVMIATVTIVHQLKQQEIEEQRRLAEEERLATMLTMSHTPDDNSPTAHSLTTEHSH